jgi:hypothetical protein
MMMPITKAVRINQIPAKKVDSISGVVVDRLFKAVKKFTTVLPAKTVQVNDSMIIITILDVPTGRLSISLTPLKSLSGYNKETCEINVCNFSLF